MTKMEAALDAVLRRAVASKDDAVIEAYREIYQKSVNPNSRTDRDQKAQAAFRLGQLLGAELIRRKVT